MAMSYQVIWPRETFEELADAWLNAPDRDAVTSASHRLDQALASNPFACGFYRDSPVNRTAIEFPLGIEFEIIEDDKQVRVLRVWSLV